MKAVLPLVLLCVHLCRFVQTREKLVASLGQGAPSALPGLGSRQRGTSLVRCTDTFNHVNVIYDKDSRESSA